MILTKRTSAADADFQLLVVQLDKELWQRYPNTQQNFAPHNKLDSKARVVLVYEEHVPIGCGAFKPTDDQNTVEIKRMYTSPAFRGRGMAKVVLRELENWAAEEGFGQVKLETGVNQPEAIAVYKRLNYNPFSNYPPYENNVESICMAKLLRT